MATAAQIRAVRNEVGTSPSDNVIAALIDEPLSVAAAALAILGPRLADMEASAASRTIDVPDDFTRTVSFSENLRSLTAKVNRLRQQVADEEGTEATPLPVMTVARLERCTPRR